VEIQRGQRGFDERIAIVSAIERLPLRVDVAIPCGLIVNELVTNALKHAFPQGRAGHIEVKLARTDRRVATLSVADDGVGLPEHVAIGTTDTLGLELVATLADQLEAEMTVERDGGTCISLAFALGDPTIDDASLPIA
jgi:two-component sensor histidine kinase